MLPTPKMSPDTYPAHSAKIAFRCGPKREGNRLSLLPTSLMSRVLLEGERLPAVRKEFFVGRPQRDGRLEPGSLSLVLSFGEKKVQAFGEKKVQAFGEKKVQAFGEKKVQTLIVKKV